MAHNYNIVCLFSYAMMKADRMIIFRGGIFMKCYVVDAFTKEVFKGNPAAVCVLDSCCPMR